MRPHFCFQDGKGRPRQAFLVIFKGHQKLRSGAGQFDQMGRVLLSQRRRQGDQGGAVIDGIDRTFRDNGLA